MFVIIADCPAICVVVIPRGQWQVLIGAEHGRTGHGHEFFSRTPTTLDGK